MNYIRYWQASGESLKTSIRTKTRLGQIAQEGRFRGGSAPYGYRLVKKGRVGKKNRELYDIEINPDEAIGVKEMFDLADHYGYGGRRISSELKTNIPILQYESEIRSKEALTHPGTHDLGQCFLGILSSV